MVSVRRVAPILLLAMTLPAFSAEKAAAPAAKPKASPAKHSSSRPPRDLHKVGDHWTPYNAPDPATYRPGSKTYAIVVGDTLWALGKRFYGNPYLWPQLWESNTWITDAHWIYPGDTLLVEGEAVSAVPQPIPTTSVQPELAPHPEPAGGAPAGAGAAGAAPAVTGQATAALGSPVALGTQADIFCYGYIGDPDESMPNVISSFEDIEAKYDVGALRHDQGVGYGEVIYIAGGTKSGLVAGDTYLVVGADKLVQHPRTKEVLGRQYEYRGQVKILCATEDEATALVTQSCTDVRVGDHLKPLPSIPIPIARMAMMPALCDPPSGKISGFIVNSKDFIYALGEGMLVEVNLGKDDMVQPGDFLTVFRENPVEGAPRQLLGEIGILTAESHTATARIVQMHFSMQVGDRVEVR